MNRPSYGNIIIPAIDRFNDALSKNGSVQLSIFEPNKLGESKDYAILVKLGRANLDVTYKFVGDRLIKLFGSNPTGKSIKQIMPKRYADETLNSYQRTAESNEPLHERKNINISLHMPFGYQRVMLPLCETDNTVSHILTLVAPNNWWARSNNDLR